MPEDNLTVTETSTTTASEGGSCFNKPTMKMDALDNKLSSFEKMKQEDNVYWINSLQTKITTTTSTLSSFGKMMKEGKA